MYGLLIERRHLEDLVEGRSMTDNRQFSTPKRGRIALVDSVTKEILGFADLKDVETIDYRTYLRQFGDSWMTGDLWASHRNYYRFRFARVFGLSSPIEGKRYPDDGVWMEIPNGLEEGKKQASLFDFRIPVKYVFIFGIFAGNISGNV